MKTLEPTRKDGNCLLTLVERRGPFSVYHRTRDNRCRGFEVIHIREHETAEVFGKIVEAYEGYPGSAAWGRDGISIPDREMAMDRLTASVALGRLATTARTAEKRIAPPVKNPKRKKSSDDVLPDAWL